MTYSRWFRIALGYLALISAQIGIWALAAPQSFYDNYPGFGRVWIAIDGPYNEHLLRDVGALNLALASVLIYAAITLSRPVIISAAIATLVWGVPHFIYHALNSDGLDGLDTVASVGGLLLFAAVPAMLLFAVSKLTTEETS